MGRERSDPTAFLDAPPSAALAEARERLERIGALDGDHRLTPHGRTIAAWPLEPRLAHMIVDAGIRGIARAAADAAALLTERGLGGADADLELRHRRWMADRSPRAGAARALAERWTKRAGGGGRAQGSDLAIALALAFTRPTVETPRSIRRTLAVGRRSRISTRSVEPTSQ